MISSGGGITQDLSSNGSWSMTMVTSLQELSPTKGIGVVSGLYRTCSFTPQAVTKQGTLRIASSNQSTLRSRHVTSDAAQRPNVNSTGTRNTPTSKRTNARKARTQQTRGTGSVTTHGLLFSNKYSDWYNRQTLNQPRTGVLGMCA